MRPLVLIFLLGCGTTAESETTVPQRAPDPPTTAELLAAAEAETDRTEVERLQAEARAEAERVREAEEAEAEEARAAEAAIAALLGLQGGESTSIGAPANGRITGAVALPVSGFLGLRSNPRRPNETGFYGTVEMVQALVIAAGFVHAQHPSSEVTVNDLGFEDGGPIPHHGSHQAGRDVDVLFYLLDAEGNPREGKGVPIDPNGRGWDFGDLSDPEDDVRVRIDIPRTWSFLEALVSDETRPVQRIFVVEHIRAMLLDHARRIRAPQLARQRLDVMTCQPGAPHDDHLHIRFFCSPEDIQAGCEDSAPMYGWHRRALRAAGVDPVIARPQRRPRRARTVSRQAAREAAGPMHPRVVRFLREREAWADKPSPGRPYCP